MENLNSSTAQGLCSVGEMLDALNSVLPLGVSLACIETAAAIGVTFRDGEYFPGELEKTRQAVDRHFLAWIPRLGIAERTAVQRLCEPVGSMLNGEVMTQLLVCLSDRIAENAVSRGYMSAAAVAELHRPQDSKYFVDMVASIAVRPPDFDGSIHNLSESAVRVDDASDDQ